MPALHGRRQIVQVAALVIVEAECLGDRVDDRI
jgi:hypothetical protein